MTQRIELFCIRQKELKLFLNDSKNWTSLDDSKNGTFVKKRSMTQKNELFFRYHSKNWTLKKPKLWFKELNFI